MKKIRWSVTGTILTVMLFTCTTWAGDLTPPAAPGSTMHTLTEIYDASSAAEPRIPIPGGSSTFTISTSGSYVLQTNMTQTLTISADNVTVDLMGFTIDPSSGNYAIDIPVNQKNLVIRNGILTGASTGLNANQLRDSNSRFENLTVSDCSLCGLYIGADCKVENVLVQNCGFFGILSSSIGRLEVCNCRIVNTSFDGLVAYQGSRIVDNVIEDSGDDGLVLFGTGSYVAGNIVKGNTDNYDVDDGNQLNLLLCEIPETLEWPCSVTLAGTLSTTMTDTDGITVAADDITIDMAGHTLIGPGANSGHGIYQNTDYRNLHVFNGKLVHWEGLSTCGICAYGKTAILHDLQAATNSYGICTGKGSTISGCTAYENYYTGIMTDSGYTISSCTAYGNGAMGINAEDGGIISECSAYENGSNGISAGAGIISECSAYENGASGIYAFSGCTISDCAANNNGWIGINTFTGCTISGCSAYENDTSGIAAYYNCTVTDCTVKNNALSGIQLDEDGHVTRCMADNNLEGIYAYGDNNRIENNNMTDNDWGIRVSAAGNFIVRNTCSDNTLNWDVVAGNVCLVVQATICGAINGDSGGTAPGSTDPNANFTY